MVTVQPLVDGKGGVFLATLPWSLLVFVAGGFLLGRTLRGRSTAHREFLLMTAIFVPFLPLGLWGGAMLANEKLDESAVVTHEARMTSKYIEPQKRGAYYYVVLESWRPGQSAETIRVSPEGYRDSREQQLWRVGTHAGRLGHEWVTSVELRR